jgi:hypothetical protein
MAVIGLMLLAGCGGTSGPSAQSNPSPTPNPGATYLRIVKPTNDTIDALGAAVHAQPIDYPKVRTAAAAAEKAYQQFNADLVELETEAPSAKTDIEALRKTVAAEVSLLGAIVASSSDINTGVNVLAFSNYSDGGAAALVRSDLKLPAP